MTMRRHRRYGAIPIVLLLGITACGAGKTSVVGSASPLTPAVATPTPSPTPTPTPSPTATPAGPVNPLTGRAGIPVGTVVAVKIDDTGNGGPQRGIDLADIVYIETAEGGVSRLVGIFSSYKPVVEPVRSVRASDSELLSQYGPITVVASGGGGDALPTLYASILHSVIDDRGDKGFARDNDHDAPYNLTANLATVTADVHGQGPKSIGFTWSASPSVWAGHPAATTIVTQVGTTTVQFVWNATLGRYIRVVGGVQQRALDGNLVSTPNVIVQFCTITPNPHDVDVHGVVSQYTHSIGSGRVVVFRNGVAISGTWSRPSLTAGTTLTSAGGSPIALTPGGAWVVLVATNASLTG
jgi:hypothetical protein